MPAASKRGEDRRQLGSIRKRPKGALRARVYSGYHPVTGKRHYISETIQPGPKAWAQAEVALTKLLNQVDERRNPKTHATVSRLLDRYLAVIDVDKSTMAGYRGSIENHIRPVLGDLPIGRVDGEVLDSFTPSCAGAGSDAVGSAGVQDRELAVTRGAVRGGGDDGRVPGMRYPTLVTFTGTD